MKQKSAYSGVKRICGWIPKDRRRKCGVSSTEGRFLRYQQARRDRGTSAWPIQLPSAFVSKNGSEKETASQEDIELGECNIRTTICVPRSPSGPTSDNPAS